VKIVLIILATLVALVAVVAIIGAMLPKQHTATRSAVVRKQPREVYALIRDFGSAPKWRKELKRVEVLTPTRFREHGQHDAVTYDVLDDQPGQRLVTRIADQNLPYSGSWTYQFEAVPEGTRVTITENGEVSNPIFRFLSRFVFGQTKTMDDYLAALQKL
jgi:uncharacterized membrane protein